MTSKATAIKENKDSLHVRLSSIQQNLKAPKAQRNSFGKFNYRSCEDILELVKPHVSGLTLVLTDKVESIGDRHFLIATVTLSDGKESVCGEAAAQIAASKKGMDEAQITGAASSYARKYALGGLFSIDDTHDADSNHFAGKTYDNAPAKPKEPHKIKQTLLVNEMRKSTTLDELKDRYGAAMDANKDWNDSAFHSRLVDTKNECKDKLTESKAP